MISAIIVNYHCVELTLKSVNSIINTQEGTEIWVVDNSVDKNQAQQLKVGLPSQVNLIINEENEGFARACNKAYRLSQGELILLLNPDAYLLPDCLTLLTQALLSNSQIAAVGPQIYWDSDTQYYLPPSIFPSGWFLFCNALWKLHPLLMHLYSLIFRVNSVRIWQGNKDNLKVPALSGGHILLKRSAIEQCGGLFDEQFFMYYEDSDLMLRLKQAKYDLYVIPKAACVHNYEHTHQKSQLMDVSAQKYFSKNYKHSLLRKLITLFPNNRTYKAWGELINLGSFTKSPKFDVPKLLQNNWLLEISSSPYFIPSIGIFGKGDIANISITCSDFLGPGDYFCRISSPDTLFQSMQQWQWKKIAKGDH